MRALEAVAKDALKCVRVRAFLVTSAFIGLPPGRLLYLKRSACTGLTRSAASLECRSGTPERLLLSLSLTHTFTLYHRISLSITLSFNYSLSPLSLFLSLTLSLLFSHSHSHSLSLSYSLSLILTHSLICFSGMQFLPVWE